MATHGNLFATEYSQLRAFGFGFLDWRLLVQRRMCSVSVGNQVQRTLLYRRRILSLDTPFQDNRQRYQAIFVSYWQKDAYVVEQLEKS